MCDFLYEDLIKLHKECSIVRNFNDDFFAFGVDGGITPVAKS